jgi:putative CocE/NonD family hydrolase
VFYPHHPDVQDGYDTVEWAAAQPWSNGKVALWGGSYGGLQQWNAAIARPPHLVAMAPVSSPWNTFGTNVWYWQPGVLGLGMAVMWTCGQLAGEAERAGVEHPVPAFAEARRASMEAFAPKDGVLDRAAIDRASLEMQRVVTGLLLSQRPLRDIAEFRELAPWFRDWCDHDDPRDPYWEKVNASAHLDALEMPIIHVTGWYDYFTKAVLDSYSTMQRYASSEVVRKAQRLVVGPWGHQPVPGAIPRSDVPIDVDPPYAPCFTEGSPVMEFFRHHLKYENTDYKDQAPIRIYVMGANEWRDEWEWPLARTEWTAYYMHSGGGANSVDGDGTMSLDPPLDDEPADSFFYDPSDPVPGPTAVAEPGGPDTELRHVGRRSDVLVYTTPPLENDIEVTGPVMLELWASSSAIDTDFTAKLIEVLPDSEAIPICQGLVRTSNTVGQPLMAGATYRFALDLSATSNLFKAGHRIRVHISSSEFPTYELNPNTGTRITHDPSGKTAVTHQNVHHDPAHPSRLILPVIPS